MKKCILYVLSFVLLSTGLSIAYSGNALAASSWDDIIQVVDPSQTLTMKAANDARYPVECAAGSQVSMTNYMGYILDPSRNTGSGSSKAFFDAYYGGDTYDHLVIYNPRGSFGTNQQTDSFTVIFTDKPNTYKYVPSELYGYSFQSQIIDPTGTLYVATVTVDRNMNCERTNVTFDDGWINVSYSAQANRPDFLYHFGKPSDPRYHRHIAVADPDLFVLPPGYEGIIPPTSFDPEGVAHKPNITWEVMDKNVIVSSENSKNTATLEEYQIYWWISNATFDGRQPDEPFALSGCTPPDFNNNFTVPVYFDYGIQAYYADENCNILQVDDEGNQLSDNMITLTIDGSNFSGSTDDHVAIIGEIPDNVILKAIRKFRPNDGGLSTLIFAPIEAVASLPSMVGTCTPISLPLMGESVELKCIRPTIQNSPMGPVYSAISVIITGMVTWFVAWRTFGTIKNIQDPQDDKVEVLKL